MLLSSVASVRNWFTASASIAALATGLAHAAPALAQSAPASPAPSPAPVPQGPAQTSPRSAGPAPAAKFGHLPVIDIIPIYTNPQFYKAPEFKANGQLIPVNHGKNTGDQLYNSGTGYDSVDVGGTFKLPITPNFSASLDRVVEGTLNVPNAAFTTKSGTSYPTFSRDAVLVYRLDEQYKRFQIEEGLYFRHRIVGGTNTSDTPYPNTISSTEAHYGYVGVTYVSPGVPWLLNSFLTLNINADTQAIDHHVGTATGVTNENKLQDRVWETDQYVQLTVPVDRKHGVNFSAQDKWGALNFYENAPFPYRYTTSQTYLFTKRFNRVFALSIRDKDQWTVQGITTTLKPNAQHNGSIDLLADFKVDLNTLH